MDGVARPATLMETLRKRDTVAIALTVLHSCDELRPLAVPRIAQPSNELAALLDARTPRNVPEELKAEFKAWHATRMARMEAKAENLRRIRTTLWAEQCLRRHQRQEHEVIRAFNRDVWFIHESASGDIAAREAQAREVA